MTPPSPRSTPLRPRLRAALAVTAALAMLPVANACASGPHQPVANATDEPSTTVTAWPPTSTAPTPSTSSAPPSSTAPSTTTGAPTVGPTSPSGPTLADYLARLPKFGPAPRPEPVWLPRAGGQASFVFEIDTNKPVAFLTIDDGAFRHPYALELIKAAKVPVTLFLTTNWVAGHTDYFKALQDTGYVTIQNHTVSHLNLPEIGYDGARSQLCPASNRIEEWFGTRPTLFRPPFGERDATTLAAAWDCGMKAGFYWRETVDSGNVYYQRDHGRIHAGDIILMHFRPTFPDDFVAALNAIKDSGLSVARLEDYVRVEGVDDRH